MVLFPRSQGILHDGGELSLAATVPTVLSRWALFLIQKSQRVFPWSKDNAQWKVRGDLKRVGYLTFIQWSQDFQTPGHVASIHRAQPAEHNTGEIVTNERVINPRHSSCLKLDPLTIVLWLQALLRSLSE